MPHFIVKRLILAVTAIVLVACRADQPATKLTNKEATAAMYAETEGRVVLGTCMPASKARYKDQVACTLIVMMRHAETSEAQMDFHWDGQKWVATSPESRDILPFPDPVLADVHAWTPNVDQLEPRFLKN
jgi:hypothetical protein